MLLNKHNLALASLASKENDRYSLKGIHVTARGTEVTDGHIAVRVSAPKADGNSFPAIDNITDQPSPDFILPADAAKKIASALPKKTNIPVIQNALVGVNPQQHTVIAVTDLDTPITFKPSMITGQFPNTDAVFPKSASQKFVVLRENEYTSVSLDARQIVRVLRELDSMMEDARYATVEIKVRTNWHAVQFTAQNDAGQTFDALIMPIRSDEVDAKVKAYDNAKHDEAMKQLPAPVKVAANAVAGSTKGHPPDAPLQDSDIPK